MRRWVLLEVCSGNSQRCFIARIEFPFSRSIEAAPRHRMLAVENLMERCGDMLRLCPGRIPGAGGVAWLHRDAVRGCYLLKDANEEWESVWDALQGGVDEVPLPGGPHA